MGQTLSEPVTAKNIASCSNERYLVGSSSMQGWRINMEDAHTQLLELPNDPAAAFFAVFDGHGGAKIAKYASQNLHNKIVSSTAYAEGKISDALIEGFLELDDEMLEDDELKEEMSGSTAIVVLVKDNFIYCANAGDSRAVISVSGRAIALSTDHKPSNEEESQRIFAAGGWVEFNRVNGNLALSRALGDFGFKKNDSKSVREQIVTACPEVEIHAITAEHEFILLACDGIWDVMSNQEAVTFCRERLIGGLVPEKVCEQLLDKCLAPDCELSGLGCDNMTAILVCLLQNHSIDEFLKQLREATNVEKQEHDVVMKEQLDGLDEEVYSTPSHSPPPSLFDKSSLAEQLTYPDSDPKDHIEQNLNSCEIIDAQSNVRQSEEVIQSEENTETKQPQNDDTTRMNTEQINYESR